MIHRAKIWRIRRWSICTRCPPSLTDSNGNRRPSASQKIASSTPLVRPVYFLLPSKWHVNQFVTRKSSICKDSVYHQKKMWSYLSVLWYMPSKSKLWSQYVQIAKVQNSNNVCLQIVQETATCQYLSLIPFINFEFMSDLLTEVTLNKFTRLLAKNWRGEIIFLISQINLVRKDFY